MPRTKSSKQWLQQHFNDVYVKKAQAEGYRTRAVYKLKEIDEKEQLLKPGMTVVELGAAPGGWTQYVAEKLKGRGRIIAVDLLPMDPIPGVEIILGDFREEEVFQQLSALIPKHSADVVLSDMAPNMSGHVAVDIPNAMYLTELAFDFVHTMLKLGGTMILKVFQGSGFEELLKQARSQFQRVVIRKPSASRGNSREIYLLASGYKVG